MTTSNHGDTIFVSVAAYRDPQLLPTLADCLAKARRPDRLRFGICWQYGGELGASEQLAGRQFAVHFVDSRLSLGACWARAEIMKLYRDEDWYLQLDSHHRFVQDWDVRLIEQAALTDSERPLLSTYAAAFTPGAEAAAPEQVTRMEFDCFTEEGAVLFRGGVIEHAPARPVPARFVSAHFLFAPGSFVREVPYDPELYFIGEEITLAVRAFTHGYDLFHPARHILWHEYTRTGRAKHWDDHTSENGTGLPWHERDAASLAKVGRLLTEPRVGPDGFGSARTVADYEEYAGISFRHRRVQDYTRTERQPPNPTSDPEWATRIQDHRIEITLGRGELATMALDDSSFCYVGVHDSEGREIFRRDAEPAELSGALAAAGNSLTLIREFSSEREPSSWTVWPYNESEGWLQPVRRPVAGLQRIFVSIASYRDPDLAATVADCLAMANFPDQLRLVVCWQHGPNEVLPDWMRTPQFEILDVDCGDSRGACWARSAIMERWAGEEWFLQIDSHMRFALGWDSTLLHQAAMTRSPKPLLSAPAPPFTVGGSRWYDSPLCFEFAGFDPNGVPEIQMGFLPAEAVHGNPVRARSLCGHFLFAPGCFARDVPYDPEMYFSAEQTTLAVRAFTHGYDLFHPTSAVVWHEYSRNYRAQHWDDHTAEQDFDEPWQELYQRGKAKVAHFFAAPTVGQYGLGDVRTVSDYEAYAGVNFRDRRVQDYTRLNQEPPNPTVDPGHATGVRDHRVEISVDLAELSTAALEKPEMWYVGIHDANGQELHRQDVAGRELADLLAAGNRATLVREFASQATPASWTIWPMQTGQWLEPLTGSLPAGSVRSADRVLAIQS
jgi:hypothetical protein